MQAEETHHPVLFIHGTQPHLSTARDSTLGRLFTPTCLVIRESKLAVQFLFYSTDGPCQHFWQEIHESNNSQPPTPPHATGGDPMAQRVAVQLLARGTPHPNVCCSPEQDIPTHLH